MRRSLWRVAALAVALVGLTLGCQRHAINQKSPPDPLVHSKKPVEGRLEAETPEIALRSYPQPPPLPATGDLDRRPAYLPASVERPSPVPLGPPQHE
jgi:hypothetical protein